MDTKPLGVELHLPRESEVGEANGSAPSLEYHTRKPLALNPCKTPLLVPFGEATTRVFKIEEEAVGTKTFPTKVRGVEAP